MAFPLIPLLLGGGLLAAVSFAGSKVKPKSGDVVDSGSLLHQNKINRMHWRVKFTKSPTTPFMAQISEDGENFGDPVAFGDTKKAARNNVLEHIGLNYEGFAA